MNMFWTIVSILVLIPLAVLFLSIVSAVLVWIEKKIVSILGFISNKIK